MRFLVMLVLALLMTDVAVADGHQSEIIERIRKVANVCISGADCGTAAPVAVVATADGGNSVEGKYNRTCVTCHGTGAAGAPMFGDRDAWAPRIEKGMTTLYESSIAGLPPAMPAKGLCMDCSDDDIRAIVDYMVDSAR